MLPCAEPLASHKVRLRSIMVLQALKLCNVLRIRLVHEQFREFIPLMG